MFSLVLYRWRSLEATLRIRLKTRGRRLKSKSWEYQRILDSREHYSTGAHQTSPYLQTWNQAPPKGQQAPEQDILEPQYTGCPKSYQTHWHLKTHYWTLHCTPEKRNPAPPTRTLTQASLTRKPWQAIHPAPPTERKLMKRTWQTARIQNGHTKHSNLNKMKRQRNSQQEKEQDKCPPNQTKEEETGNLPDKEFWKW